MNKKLSIVILILSVLAIAAYGIYITMKKKSHITIPEGTPILTEKEKNFVIGKLNKAFADEWFAYYQYWIGAKVIIGSNLEKVKKELIEHANDELRHADMLADRIVKFGGTPLLNPKNWFKETICGFEEPKDPSAKAIIKQNLDAEICAVKVYKKMAEEFKTKDPITHKMILSILEDEEHHVKDLNELLAEH
jgi:bacterioferritin